MRRSSRNSEYQNLIGKILDFAQNPSLLRGSRLPSERDFQRMWGVPRPTINKAIACLIAQGHLQRDGYKLTIAPPSEAPAAPAVHILHPHPDCPLAASIRERLIEAAHDVASTFHTHAIPILARSAAQQRSQLNALRRSGTAGFVLWPVPGAEVADLLEKFRAGGVPFVTCDQDVGHQYFVGTDNDAGMRLAVEHLQRLGHRRLAYVTQSLAISSLKERFEGYEHHCDRLGLANSGDAVVEVPSTSLEHARLAWHQLHSRYPAATGICCSNDLLALRLIEFARESGIDVPRKLSVVGFDDIERATFAVPPLTTIAQDFRQLGILATHALYQQIRRPLNKDSQTTLRIRLEPSLIVRETTRDSRFSRGEARSRVAGRTSIRTKIASSRSPARTA